MFYHKSGFRHRFLIGFMFSAFWLSGHGFGDIPIPAESDWTDYGIVFEHGALGEWDFQLWGGFSGSAVKKDGTYYLYYQGASGYRIVDDSVTWRAIGVATSPDGINFTKYAGSPVITFFPNNNGEEGAVSCGATLDTSGEIVIHYGANKEQSATLIHADGRLTISSNGLDFTDQGIVLNHTNSSIWGYGDELFPVISFQHGSTWYVYYIPNGTAQSRKLGVAWGPSRDNLTSSSAALSGGSTISAWGMGGYAQVGTDTYALFISDVTKSRIEVRTINVSTPNQLSAPIQTYLFSDFGQGTVILDSDTNTWFMYYRNKPATSYGVKLAPAGVPDSTPPTAPGGIVATPLNHRQIDLSWDPATDSETGIVMYRVFRDGSMVAAVKGLGYSDTGLSELTEYSYEISATNYHGVEGPNSPPINVSTPADTTGPVIESVSSSGDPCVVSVVFDEAVEEGSAENPVNYVIDSNVTVTAALLEPDLKTVTLTTSAHHSCFTYTLTVNDVNDGAGVPNTIIPDSQMTYTHSGSAGLAGYWGFDEAGGTTAYDTSNFRNDGSLVYPGKQPATWTTGKINGALQFDGQNDLVTIVSSNSLEDVTDGSHTFMAWVRATDLPPNTNDRNTYYSIVTREYTGLYYDYNGKFRAVVKLSTGTEVALLSGVFSPGQWHHVAMVVDDSGGKLHLYVDGQEVSGSPSSYTGLLRDFQQSEYYIGTSDPLEERWDYRFKGVLDAVSIYNRSLTTQEIWDIWNAGQHFDVDLNADGRIDCGDLKELAGEWLRDVSPAGSIPEDIIEDGTVDFSDFGALADRWLTEI